MKNFLFLNLKEKPSEDILNIISQYKEVHLNLLNLEKMNINLEDSLSLFSKCVNKSLCIYSKDINHIIFLENMGINVHYCWVNNQKLNEDFISIVNKNKENEFFWIINDDLLEIDKEDLLFNLKKINRPICISFTKTLLGEDISNYKEIKKMISWIQENWENTLFSKEKSLYVENWVDEKYLSWQDNVYYDTEEKIEKNLVMGIYGDIVVTKDDSQEKINILNLKKNKECPSCECFTFCRERGIGLIMNEINLHECISVKFLKNRA